MKPDRTNYEIWLIDYLDGNLDQAGIGQLLSFLKENPDINKEFDEILKHKVTPPDNSFKYKGKLIKTNSELDERQFEYLCVADSEKDLSDEQSAELQKIIGNNQEKIKTYALIKSTKLAAPERVYRYKYKLRKFTVTQKVIRFSMIGLSAAAVAAIMISIYSVPVKTIPRPAALTFFNSNYDSGIVKTATGNISKRLNEDTKPTAISKQPVAVSKIQGTVSEEIKLNPEMSGSNKGPIENISPGVLFISKIDFRKEVHLVENSFNSTLVAINTDSNLQPEDEPGGFNGFIAKTFREKLLKATKPDKSPLKVYEIAGAGIDGLNKLLGWNMSLQKNMDDKGEVKSVYFNSRFLKFNASVKKASLIL
jgi:hypothetical protein